MALKATEKGQALILITLAIVVLFGFVSLAIDGSVALSDRRHAQNAADTSALAAALAKARGQNYSSAATTRAASNGYDNNGTTNIVEVYLCNNAAATCTDLPTGANPTEYVQVKITSHVKTYFARIIGRSEVINYVNAVAHASPSYNTTMFGGQAIVALNQSDCKAMEYNGSGQINVTGSGIFINSRCDIDNDSSLGALNSSATGVILKAPCYDVVGGVQVKLNTLQVDGSCPSSTNSLESYLSNALSMFPTPNIPCDTSHPATYTSTVLNPGYYTGTTFPPSGTGAATMNPGIYCVDIGNHTFSLSGQMSLTGDNVLIYMKSGSVNITSGNFNLSAIEGKNPDGTDFYYNGLLLVIPSDTCPSIQSVSIQGNGQSSFTGTIYAPCSYVKLAGSSGATTTFNNQIVADMITLTGGAELDINFDANQQWQPPISPAIELMQ